MSDGITLEFQQYFLQPACPEMKLNEQGLKWKIMNKQDNPNDLWHLEHIWNSSVHLNLFCCFGLLCSAFELRVVVVQEPKNMMVYDNDSWDFELGIVVVQEPNAIFVCCLCHKDLYIVQ